MPGQFPLGFLITILATYCLFGPNEVLAEKRVALVVGNGAYTGIAPLVKPINDAKRMAEVLKDLGFQVIVGTDTDRRRLDKMTDEFRAAVKDADVGLFYYSGHGFQTNRATQQHPVNHVVPIDFKVDENDPSLATLPLDTIIATLKQEARVGFIFMDACRNEPALSAAAQRAGATRAVTISRGFSPVDVSSDPAPASRLNASKGPSGLLIAYATDPGNVAFEGNTGTLSPFTSALVKHLAARGLSIAEVMGRVSSDVATETRGQQTPWSVASLTAGTYRFLDAPAGAAVPNSADSVRPKASSRAPTSTTGARASPPKSGTTARSNLPPNIGVGVGSGL